MSQKELSIHYVCTYQEAMDLIEERDDFWVSNCGCRQRNKKGCNKSGMEVCLSFTSSTTPFGKDKRKITKEYASKILNEGPSSRLVPRPYRDVSRHGTEGICLCCNDCCYYFLDSKEICDKGQFVEATDMNECTHCGICTDVCYFNARKIKGDKLRLEREQCYGCGLCAKSCPTTCIQMVKRSKNDSVV